MVRWHQRVDKMSTEKSLQSTKYLATWRSVICPAGNVCTSKMASSRISRQILFQFTHAIITTTLSDRSQESECVNQLSKSQISYTLCRKKSISDIFDSNLKTNYQILIIFGTNISDTLPSNDHLISHLIQRLFLHYLGRVQPAKYHFFIQCDVIAWLT